MFEFPQMDEKTRKEKQELYKQYLLEESKLPKRDNSLDGMNVTLYVCYVLCGFLFLFCLLGLFVAISKGVEEVDYLKENGCTLVSEVPTGNRIYCGKACMRNEVRQEYSCTKFSEPLIKIR